MTQQQYSRKEFLEIASIGFISGGLLVMFGRPMYHSIEDWYLNQQIEQLEEKAVEITKRLGNHNQDHDDIRLRVTKRGADHITIESLVEPFDGREILSELTIDERADIPGPSYIVFTRVISKKKRETYHEIPGTPYAVALGSTKKNNPYGNFFENDVNSIFSRRYDFGQPLVKEVNVGRLNSDDWMQFKRDYVGALKELVAHGEAKK